MTDLSLRIHQIVLEQSRRANVGHIGSSLSIADVLSMALSAALAARREHSDWRVFALVSHAGCNGATSPSQTG